MSSPHPRTQYRFERERRDYSDFAGGRVVYGRPGTTSFPVRLASEMFQRALEYTDQAEVTLYDPLCGAGYVLTVIALLHGSRLRAVLGSDADPALIELAERNLSLLSHEGLDARIAHLTRDREAFGKASHSEALDAARRLRQRVVPELLRRVWVADATSPVQLRQGLQGQNPDIVIADVPYGELTRWSSNDGSMRRLLDSLADVLVEGTIVALSATKADDLRHPAFRRLEHWRLGKRQLSLLRR